MHLDEMETTEELLTHLRRHHNSASRPAALLDWVLGRSKVRSRSRKPAVREQLEREMALTFWDILRVEWKNFDGFDDGMYGVIMSRFKPYWTPQPEWQGLPDQMTVYRGQSDDDDWAGLSWTLERSVAERFTKGHRGIQLLNPTVLEHQISRNDVALVFHGREQTEVVLWSNHPHGIRRSEEHKSELARERQRTRRAKLRAQGLSANGQPLDAVSIADWEAQVLVAINDIRAGKEGAQERGKDLRNKTDELHWRIMDLNDAIEDAIDDVERDEWPE